MPSSASPWSLARDLTVGLALGLAAGAMLTAGCVSQATHDAVLRQQTACQRALAGAAKIDEDRTRKALLEQQSMLVLVRRLEQRLRVARLELEIHRNRATEPARLARQLADRVVDIPGAARLGVAVIEHRQRATIRIPESALFKPGARTLTRPGLELLAAMAPVLRDLGGDAFGASAPAFEVGGHTDEIPAAGGQVRWDLSLARAVAVTRALEKSGVPAFRLHPTGHAGLSPLDPAGTPEARARNRRVELVVVPQRAPGAGMFRPPPAPSRRPPKPSTPAGQQRSIKTSDLEQPVR